jgi:hypothetical protein
MICQFFENCQCNFHFSIFFYVYILYSWHDQHVNRDRLVDLQDLSGRSLIELAKIHFQKKFQLKQMNVSELWPFKVWLKIGILGALFYLEKYKNNVLCNIYCSVMY